MNPRSGRTIPLYFKVSPEEKEIIDKKMELLGTHNQRAYLRKMAVDGYVVRVDMTDVKELAALLRTCSNNLNQIARRVNSTGNLYGEDIADLKTRYGELWGAFSSLLSKFEDNSFADTGRFQQLNSCRCIFLDFIFDDNTPGIFSVTGQINHCTNGNRRFVLDVFLFH